MTRQYWLCKSEPDAYSIDDLTREGTGTWDGVRNYQARNFLVAMKSGDRVFFYQSSCKEIGIVGEMEVIGEAFADPLQFIKTSDYFDAKASKETPRWYARHLKLVAQFPRIISLQELKAQPTLKKMTLLQRGSRLSVQPVTKGEYTAIQKLALKKQSSV